MPTFETVRHVNHSPERMFDLVADVEKYPEFVPLCERLIVRQRQVGACPGIQPALVGLC